MKTALLRFSGAAVIIVLVLTVIFLDLYTQRLSAEDAKEQSALQQQGEKLLAASAAKQKEILQEQKRQMLRKYEDEQLQKAVYNLSAADGRNNLFTNKVDGYSILIPVGMKADMRYSNVRAVLESRDLKIEIYRQNVGYKTGGVESYINYSNQFIENNIDHYKEFEGTVRIDGRAVSYLQWSRRPLQKIENDKCFYASVEVPLSRHEVITFFFKSSRKFENKEYLDIVRSLKITEKTADPYVMKMYRTKNMSWDTKTADVYDRCFGVNKGLSWGIFENNAPVDFTELKKIETKLDFTFPILLYYTGFQEYKEMHPNLKIALANAKKEGRILELTLQTVAQSPGKGNMVYDVLDGKYDAYLKNYAKTVVDSGDPVLFRLGNEMNGDWCVYSSHHTSKDTDIFKAFYLYVYRIFQNAGADNVIWIWNPNGKAFPDFKWNDELCYYPGDEYVDVVGMTSYNTGTYYESENWTEFDAMYGALYRKYAEQYEKPLMITEFSSSSVGGSKEDWVVKMFRNIEKYDRIKVAIWWDGCDWDSEGNVARSYFIDETDELERIFRDNLKHYK